MKNDLKSSKYYELIRKKILLVFAIVTICLFANACSSAGYLKVIPNEENVKNTHKEYQLSNNKVIHETNYILPEKAIIKKVDYEDSQNSLYIEYSDNKGKKILVLDTKSDTTKWTSLSNMTEALINNEFLILYDKKYNRKIFDLSTGNLIRNNIESYIYTLNDGKALILSPKRYSLIEMQTGKTIWGVPGQEWVGNREEYYNDSTYYIIAEGIHALDLKKGKKWEYLISNSYKNVGKEIAIQAGLTCLAVLGGGHSYRTYKPDITMNMNSAPLFTDDELYFVAKNKIVCLEKLTGQVIWENTFEPELEAMNLYNVSEEEIALVGLGRKTVNNHYMLAEPPTIRLIEKSSGEITALYNLESAVVVQTFTSTNENFFLLTAENMYTFDRDLTLLSVIKSINKYGNFLSFLSVADTIVLRTSNGLLGLSKETFSETWFNTSVVPLQTSKEEWKIPILEKIVINNSSTVTSTLNNLYYWTLGSNSIKVFGMKQWNEVLNVPIFGKNIKKYSNSHFTDFEGNRIKLITIN